MEEVKRNNKELKLKKTVRILLAGTGNRMAAASRLQRGVAKAGSEAAYCRHGAGKAAENSGDRACAGLLRRNPGPS